MSSKLKRLEADISDVSYKVTRTSKSTAQNTKGQNSEWKVKRAADRVLRAVDEVNKSIRVVENELLNQSRLINNAVGGYKSADKINKVNNGVMNYIGPNLAGVFGYAGFGNYTTKVNNKK